MGAVGNAVKQMSAQQIAEFESKGSISLAGETLGAGDIKACLSSNLHKLAGSQHASDMPQPQHLCGNDMMQLRRCVEEMQSRSEL